MSFYDKEHWMNKGMTEKEAIEKVQDLKDRTNRLCVNFWIRKGFSESEAKVKISEIQRNNSLKVNRKKVPYETRISYWLDKGYDLESAKIKLKERQTTFTLEKCIKKYGEIKGTEVYNDRQKRWQKTLKDNNDMIEINKKKGLTKQKFIEKYGEEKYEIYRKLKGYSSSKEGYIKKYGIEKYIERINNLKILLRNNGFNKHSKISIELFLSIEKEIGEECFYGENEKIIQFYNDEKYFCFYVDFMYKNKIIEFYGDYFHANPKLYKFNKIIGSKYKFNTAEKIWERDKLREELIINRGYDILIIWEKDYKDNKEEIKNKCIKWIKNL